MKKNPLSILLGLVFFSLVAIQSPGQTIYTADSGYNYPVLNVTADYAKLPTGSWYYMFTNLPMNGSNGIYNDSAPQTEQVLYILDDSIRPVYSLDIARWYQNWAAYVPFWNNSDSTLGYMFNWSYYVAGTTGQASGLYPRFKVDEAQAGFVNLDTLPGAPGIPGYTAPTMDPHGIYLGDSIYAVLQNYGYMGDDTGFGVGIMTYGNDSLVAYYNSQNPSDGIPDSQSYHSTCPAFQDGLTGDVDHPNFIDGVGDTAIIVSLRHQDEICRLQYNKQTGTVTRTWRLRKPGDPFSSFTWVGDSVGFTGQHDVKIVSIAGNKWYISVFDDGECVPREESRYLLLQLDLDSMICTVIRSQYLGYHTQYMGSAMPISTASDIPTIAAAPILYATGGFDTSLIQQSGIDIVGIQDTSGLNIATIKFQSDTIRNLPAAYGLCYQSRAYNTPVLDNLRPKITTSCKGDSMTLTLSRSYDVISWSASSSTSQSITLPQSTNAVWAMGHNYSAQGEWWAFSYGCTVDTTTDTTTAIKDISSTVGVYPNPAHGFVNVISNFNTATPYTVYDTKGEAMKEGVFAAQPIQILKLDNLSQGVYFLSLSISGQPVTKKIVCF